MLDNNRSNSFLSEERGFSAFPALNKLMRNQLDCLWKVPPAVKMNQFISETSHLLCWCLGLVSGLDVVSPTAAGSAVPRTVHCGPLICRAELA